MDVTYCKNCGLILDDLIDINYQPRNACPNCGDLERVHDTHMEFKVIALDKWKFVDIRPGAKRPVWEIIVGDDLHRISNTWMKLERHIDRENDKYIELVKNPKTGEVIRYCEEPLSQHRGRGSAKHKK